jgi:hypothetical protein
MPVAEGKCHEERRKQGKGKVEGENDQRLHYSIRRTFPVTA